MFGGEETGTEPVAETFDAGVVETEVESTETSPEPEGAKPGESVRESIEKVLKQESKEPSEEGEEPAAKAPEKVIKRPKTEKQILNDRELSAPEGFKPHEVEEFNKIPSAAVKRAIHRRFNGLKAESDRVLGEYRSAVSESRGIVEAVQPYAPHFGKLGYTLPQAIAGLCAVHANLADPEKCIPTFIQLGKDLGIDVSHLENGKTPQHQKPQQVDISRDPTITGLQQKLDALLHEKEAAAIQPVADAFDAVINEIDPTSGDYRFLELQDADFRNRARPVVYALIETRGLTPGDALKQAWSSLTGKPIPFSQGPAKPFANQANTNDRARSASVSVRGQIAPRAATAPVEGPPRGLTVRETIQWVEEQRARGIEV